MERKQSELDDFLRERIHVICSPAGNEGLINANILTDLAGRARVIAVGEGSHFIKEYWEMRRRLFELFHKEHNVRIFAMEFGFSEALLVDRWIGGEASAADLRNFSESIDNWGAGSTMRWLRSYNSAAGGGISFAGIDIPEAAGTLLPSLLPFTDYVKSISLPTGDLQEAIEISDEFASGSVVAAAAKWQTLPESRRDRLTSILSNTLMRFTTLRDYYTQTIPAKDYSVALRHLEAALYADYMIRAVAQAGTAGAFMPDMSAREYFMARSVIWHLDANPGQRIYLIAHNNHIQKTNVVYGKHTAAIPMGYYLQRFLGAEYCAIALTSSDNHTADMSPDSSRPAGFAVVDVALDKAREGSVNAFIESNAPPADISLIDMRHSPLDFNGIRSQGAYVDTSVKAAFDAVISIPKITVETNLRL
ncbi:MAG: erythromycin esterase family protein [Tannerellaceae bacterium]|jgi:erythromycin esterase|nr:erythromycin esterase family protein [Tannerellaceae bacterium]